MYEVTTKNSILKPTTFEKNKSVTNPKNNGAAVLSFSGSAKIQYEKTKKPKFSSRNNLILIGFRKSSNQKPIIIDERMMK